MDNLIERAQRFLVVGVVRDSLQVAVIAALFMSVEEVVRQASLVRQTVVKCVKDVEVFLSPADRETMVTRRRKDVTVTRNKTAVL